jgi:hypothetical protein
VGTSNAIAASIWERGMTLAFLLAILFGAVTLWWVFGS